MTIVPICRRELLVGSRRGRPQSERAWFAGTLLVTLLGTFASWFCSGQLVGRYVLPRLAVQTFLFVVIVHALAILGRSTSGALSIAGEMDQKSLGFLLATRLSSAEIVLGKLTVCLAGFMSCLLAGLPIMILLNVLGGVRPTLILLAYAGIISTEFLMLSLAIWVSSAAPDGRRAVGATILYVIAWLIIPVFVGMTPLLTSIGLRPPGFLITANAWVLSSSPISLLHLFVGGAPSNAALYHSVGRMIGLQLAASLVLLLAAIFRLRPAFRANVGGDGRSLLRRLSWPAWRFRPRPSVSDDPILWREMYTSRSGLLGQLAGFGILAAVYGVLGYFTFYFARRAFVELWHHGYLAAHGADSKPELNLILRFFLDDSGTYLPVDASRFDFNIFLRMATIAILSILVLVTAAITCEGLATERAKNTWDGLIATPLSARDILLAKLRAAIWRLRGLTITILALWTLGLISGAVHPLGFLAAVLTLATSMAFYLALGLLIALRSGTNHKAAGQGTGLVLLPIASGFLPFMIPGGIGSIAWGAASTPLLGWLSLVSYREAGAAWHHAAYPALQWIRIESGEGFPVVVLIWFIAVLAPALGTCWIWNYCLLNFDRLIGRPTKTMGKAPASPGLLIAHATALRDPAFPSVSP